MARDRSWFIVVFSAACLLAGVGLAFAQKAGDDKARAQAIESVKKNLARDPNNPGLQHALQCLEQPGRCNDQRQLDQAIGSVKDNLKHHPEDQGMHHALDDLERHHQDLEHGATGHDRPMPHDASPRGDAPHSSGASGGMHR